MSFPLTVLALVALCALTYRFVLVALPAAVGFQILLAVLDANGNVPVAILLGLFAASCVWFVSQFLFASSREIGTHRLMGVCYGVIAGVWCYALVVQALEFSVSPMPFWQGAFAACCGTIIGVLSIIRFAALPIFHESR
jgi:hypothetical protein